MSRDITAGRHIGAVLAALCGIGLVDLRSGQVIAFLEFRTAVEEIFDVQLLPGIRFPEVFGFQKESLQHTFIIPPEEHRVIAGLDGRINVT